MGSPHHDLKVFTPQKTFFLSAGQNSTGSLASTCLQDVAE